MKTGVILTIIFALLVVPFFSINATAQGDFNEITYEIPSVYYQAQGRSTQFQATVEYDDTTHIIEALEMEVPLNSFINTYGGTYNYIAAFGNAFYHPWLRFESSKIEDKGEIIEMRGTLFLRGDFRPLTIIANKTEKNGQLYLYGDFTLNLRDYFFLTPAPANVRIPPYIDMSFNIIFDISQPEEG